MNAVPKSAKASNHEGGYDPYSKLTLNFIENNMIPKIGKGLLSLEVPVREYIRNKSKSLLPEERASLEEKLKHAVEEGKIEAELNQAIGGIVRGSVAHLQEAFSLGWRYYSNGQLDEDKLQNYLLAISNALTVSPLSHKGNELSQERLNATSYRAVFRKYEDVLSKMREAGTINEKVGYVPIIINKGLKQKLHPGEIARDLRDTLVSAEFLDALMQNVKLFRY